MIGDTLEYLRLQIREHLGMHDSEITLGHLHSRRDDSNKHGIRIALVNVTEEPALRQPPHDTGTRTGEPLHSTALPTLNLYIVVAFDFDDYGAGLNLLAKTLEFFQAMPILDAALQRQGRILPPALQRVLIDVQNCDMAQLSDLWKINGGTYQPSLLYRVRLVQASTP